MVSVQYIMMIYGSVQYSYVSTNEHTCSLPIPTNSAGRPSICMRCFNILLAYAKYKKLLLVWAAILECNKTIRRYKILMECDQVAYDHVAVHSTVHIIISGSTYSVTACLYYTVYIYLICRFYDRANYNINTKYACIYICEYAVIMGIHSSYVFIINKNITYH